MDEAENQDCEAMGCGERTSPKAILGFGYGSIPINTIFRGMNIQLPAILMFTRGTRFWHTAIWRTATVSRSTVKKLHQTICRVVFFRVIVCGSVFLGPLRSRNITKVEFNIIQLHFHRKPRWKSPFLVELSCWNPIFCWHNVHCCWRHIDVCCQICHSCWQHRIFNFRYKYLLIASNLHFWVNYV